MLHDRVLTTELKLPKMKDPTHPVFTAKVPKIDGFCNEASAYLMFLRFDDIFNMLHMFRLDRSFVRLIVLSMAHQVSKEKIGGVAIADPHYMIETNFRSPQGQKFMAGHLEELLLQHKWKDFILFPYFQVIPYAIIN